MTRNHLLGRPSADAGPIKTRDFYVVYVESLREQIIMNEQTIAEMNDLFEKEDYKAALTACDQLIESDPNDDPPLTYPEEIGRCYQIQLTAGDILGANLLAKPGAEVGLRLFDTVGDEIFESLAFIFQAIPSPPSLSAQPPLFQSILTLLFAKQ